jgi:hypothetical protein
MKASLLRARPGLRGRMLLRVLFNGSAQPLDTPSTLTPHTQWPAPPHIVPPPRSTRLPVDASPLK